MIEEYDAFEHLCDVVFDGEDTNGLMFYWKAFFDRSGKDTPILMAAGYLSTRNKWKQFKREWNPLLTTDGRVDILHTTDFEAGQKAFTEARGWPKERREIVRSQLIDAVDNANLEVGAACSVVMDDYEDVMKGWRREAFGSPYQFAMTSCMRSVSLWCQFHKINEPIACVIEAGDVDEPTLNRTFHQLFANRPYRQFFRLGSLTFVPKAQQVPLQAADMLAHYMWKWVRKQPLPEVIGRLIDNKGDRLIWSHFDREALERETAKDDVGRSRTFPEGTITIKSPPFADVKVEADFTQTLALLDELEVLAEAHPDRVYSLIKDTPSVSKLFAVDAENDVASGAIGLRVSLKPTEFALSNVAALRATKGNIDLGE